MKDCHPISPIDPSDRRRRLNERLRAEFIPGARDGMAQASRRSMTAEELDRVLRRYPGDV